MIGSLIVVAINAAIDGGMAPMLFDALLAVADPTLFGVGSSLAMAYTNLDPSQNPKVQYETAMGMCRQTRWLEHTSEQMFKMAADLVNDASVLEKQSKDLVKTITSNTATMKRQLQTMKRRFKVQLALSILGSIVLVGIFSVIAVQKGNDIRSHLSQLRGFESRYAS